MWGEKNQVTKQHAHRFKNSKKILPYISTVGASLSEGVLRELFTILNVLKNFFKEGILFIISTFMCAYIYTNTHRKKEKPYKKQNTAIQEK